MNFVVNFARFLEHLFCITYEKHIQNRCSKKSRKIHGKTPMLESLFNKVAGLRPANTSAQVFSCQFWEISIYMFFTEYL